MATATATGGLAEELLQEAVRLRASDIHLDPDQDGLQIRLRVDGRFLNQDHLTGEVAERLLGCLKVMAGLMVYRCDIPQEGRLELPGGHDGRLALIPSVGGEKATVRIFDPESDRRTLDDLGLGAASREWLGTRLAADHGLLLVVGPSGSGKTTTLYSCLGELLSRRGDFCQICTIEDPVERKLAGCVQVEVDPVRQLDFAAGLKFLLRQDPEVLLVGEIRDASTARIAVRAAMTGHLVLSGMHCGRASEARPRLLEMGVERWAVDIALGGVVAQRLLRSICTTCSGAGCDRCLNTGYWGRVVVSEVLDPGDEQCREPLPTAAKALVNAGITTAEELDRVFGPSIGGSP